MWKHETLQIHRKCTTHIRDLQINVLNHMPCMQWVCMRQACLPMQSCTDGCVGGWVLSAHRSSCGSVVVVPLLFTTQARRACQTCSTETCQGCTLCLDFCCTVVLHYNLITKRERAATVYVSTLCLHHISCIFQLFTKLILTDMLYTLPGLESHNLTS